MMTISKNTGTDYLIRDVGLELMSPEQGFSGEIPLFSKILFDNDWSIKDVVTATLKVISKQVEEHLIEIANSSRNEKLSSDGTLKASLENIKGDKRIVLVNKDNWRVTQSPFHAPHTNIAFIHKNVEYIQSGVLGSIYSRKRT
tara:strand:- start:9727 stop:10155 length:429 start_codon:yes stop_codon:yes gene_type:complete